MLSISLAALAVVPLAAQALAPGSPPGPEAPSPWTLSLLMLALGGCNGSLAELISRRLPMQRSLWWPPSACDACGRRLRWWHNLPLISYPCLRGRCAFCRARIPARSWAVEVVMAGVVWALWWRLGMGPSLLVWLPLSVTIMAVSLCDLDHWWVPDLLTVASAVWVAACTWWLPERAWSLVAMGLLPAALLAGVAWIFARLRGIEGLGQGDIKWAAVMGAAVAGPAACSMIFWASLQGAATALALRAWRSVRAPRPGADASSPAAVPPALADDADWQPPPGALPFAPFIGLGALETVIFPDFFAAGVAPLLAAMGYAAG